MRQRRRAPDSQTTVVTARRAGVLATLVAAGLACAACGGRSGAATITLYNGQHVQTTDQLVAGFERATGITVKVRSDDEDTLADEIVTEGARSPADVVYTENSQALEYLQSKGLLARVDPSTLSHTPAAYDSPRDDWMAVSARVSVLIYDPALISAADLPHTVLAMAEPRYAGKLAIAAGESDFQPIVTAVLVRYGERQARRWLEGLKSNAGSHVYPDNEAITDAVSRGAVAFGLINQYYWYRLRAEIGARNVHSKIAYFDARDPGYVIDVSGAAVLASSRHQAAAQRFLAYLASKAGQEVIANPRRSISFEYPLDSGVKTLAPERPFADLRPYPVTVAQLGDGAAAVALLRDVGLL